MIEAVLFDLDGTLVDSLADLAKAVNFALNQFGFPTHPTEAFAYFVGDGTDKMLERALPAEKATSAWVKTLKPVFFSYYGQHFADQSVAYPDMPRLIQALSARGVRTGVVTNKAEAMAASVLHKLYGDVFDVIYAQRDGRPVKPDPTMALLALADLGVRPERCLFLGDSGVDMQTAVRCGAVPVGETWGFRTEEELLRDGAKYILHAPMELLNLLSGGEEA